MKRSLLLLACLMIVGSFGAAGAAALSISFSETSTDFGTSSDGTPPGNIEDVLSNHADSLIGDILVGIYGDTSLTLKRVAQQTWTGIGFQTNLLAEYAGYAPANIVGWYDVNDSAMQPTIFLGSAVAGDSADFSFNQQRTFGFYLDPNGSSADRMYSGLAPYQAVVYQVLGFAGEYIVGFEDLRLDGGDKDFQDFIMRAKVMSVPEPSTMILFGIGLIGLAGLRRKIKR